jgi:hypothetical protein
MSGVSVAAIPLNAGIRAVLFGRGGGTSERQLLAIRGG